jgi:hypothetical protein
VTGPYTVNSDCTVTLSQSAAPTIFRWSPLTAAGLTGLRPMPARSSAGPQSG